MQAVVHLGWREAKTPLGLSRLRCGTSLWRLVWLQEYVHCGTILHNNLHASEEHLIGPRRNCACIYPGQTPLEKVSSVLVHRPSHSAILADIEMCRSSSLQSKLNESQCSGTFSPCVTYIDNKPHDWVRVRSTNTFQGRPKLGKTSRC